MLHWWDWPSFSVACQRDRPGQATKTDRPPHVHALTHFMTSPYCRDVLTSYRTATVRERFRQQRVTIPTMRHWLCALVLMASTLHADDKLTAVRFAKLWDGARVIDGALVVIEKGRIQSVTAGNPAPPANADVIDWSRYYGLPGLIDVHTHMTYYWDREPGTRPLGQSRTAAVTVFLAQENARKTLEAGVTTVRDLGSSEYADIAMRDLINRGAMIGPRMFVCGYGLSVTGRPARPGYAFPTGGTADGIPEVLRVVRQQIAAGADVIKMYGSTGSDQDV